VICDRNGRSKPASDHQSRPACSIDHEARKIL
jgi:hypothetical protein